SSRAARWPPCQSGAPAGREKTDSRAADVSTCTAAAGPHGRQARTFSASMSLPAHPTTHIRFLRRPVAPAGIRTGDTAGQHPLGPIIAIRHGDDLWAAPAKERSTGRRSRELQHGRRSCGDQLPVINSGRILISAGRDCPARLPKFSAGSTLPMPLGTITGTIETPTLVGSPAVLMPPQVPMKM